MAACIQDGFLWDTHICCLENDHVSPHVCECGIQSALGEEEK